MSNWSKSNYAQWGTYRALVVGREIDSILVSFSEVEKYKMPGLSFYVLAANVDDLKHRAELVSMELFNFMVINYAPEWQDKKSVDSTREALNKFISVLVDKNKSISDLASEVNGVFKFSNE